LKTLMASIVLVFASGLNADILNAKEALAITKKAYDDQYLFYKASCDAVLSDIYSNIKSAASNQQREIKYRYWHETGKENTYFKLADMSARLPTEGACPLSAIVVQLNKQGYGIQTSPNDLTIQISW